MKEKNSFEIIYEMVKRIPRGYVATYGQLATLAGNPRWARVVGYALHVNPDPDNIPCYRVVNKEGRASKAFAFGGKNRQIELLKAEGIEFIYDENKKEYFIDMKKYQWEETLEYGSFMPC